MLEPTDEERRLLDLLTPMWWSENAPKRKLSNLTLLNAELTPSGVEVTLRLDGDETFERVQSKADSLRALLDVYTSDMSDLTPGARSSIVRFAVRTRYITDELDMLWHPGIDTLGRNVVTGEEVDFPSEERLLVGGASGSGKSWSTRALMARAVVRETEKLAGFIDGKGEEASVLRKVCPAFVDHDEIIEGIESAWEEMEKRKAILARENLSVWHLSMGPRLIYVIDEGQAVLSVVDAEDKARARLRRSDEGYEGPEKLVMQKLVELSSQGRSREVILMWMTQNPITTPPSPGITSTIRANFDYSLCLRVNSLASTKVVLGEESGVKPHKLARGARFRGHGYLSSDLPNMLRTWTVTDEMFDLLAYPDHGRGKYPRDVALKALRKHPGKLWTPEVLTSHIACGTNQAARFLRSFADEGLVEAHGSTYRAL